jgi:hypothetical protein
VSHRAAQGFGARPIEGFGAASYTGSPKVRAILPEPAMSQSNGISRFLGGPPGAVLFKLIIASVLVGVVMAALGLNPEVLFRGIRNLIRGILDLSFETLREAFRWFVYGAVIVVPIFVLMRLFAKR